MIKTDFLIVGSGIAGLTFALKVAQRLPGSKVTILTKAHERESNTRYAQGGIAVAWDSENDSFYKHITDTLKAGDGLCDKEVVKFVVEEGAERLSELIRWGAAFDKQKKGEYDLAREGGHTANRILHRGDSTGREIEKTLLNQVYNTPNIKVLSHYFVLDIIAGKDIEKSDPENRCYGVYALHLKNKKIEKVAAKITLMATGGVGQVYQNTTNPLIATGDGIAMAHRAGSQVKNMEFVQFHPTALYHPGESPSFLISEAVRGAGAILKTKAGKQFMQHYDPRKELASRDIVARAIDTELKKNGDRFVYLDCRHIAKKHFIKYFPNIYKKCQSLGLDVSKNMIPVVPAAHYLCGGIKVDENGNTDIDNLYACGECSFTGLHGANRLASNSLLEALVFAHRSYKDAVKKIKSVSTPAAIRGWKAKNVGYTKDKSLLSRHKKELQESMSMGVGIVKSSDSLKKAMELIDTLSLKTEQILERGNVSLELFELRNLLDVARLTVHQSMKRKVNRGVFYNKDLTKKRPARTKSNKF